MTNEEQRCPCRRLKEMNNSAVARQGPLHLQYLLTASKHPHSTVSRCCCSPLVPINVLEHPDATFSQSERLNQLPNRHGPLLRLSFLQGALLLNSNSVVERELLVMGVQRLEHIISIDSTNLRTWRRTEGR